MFAELKSIMAGWSMGHFRYNSPWTQVFLVGLIAFLSVGMFNTLSNLGGGGLDNVQLSDISNGVLYAVSCVTGFVAGGIVNVIGVPIALSLGAMGYAIYIGALLCYHITGIEWFLILSGGILGFAGSLFWTAQGCVVMAYPMEQAKGRSFTLFWSVLQAGTIVGASIAFALEFSSLQSDISSSVYVVFLSLALFAPCLSWFVLPAKSVVRGDGTVVRMHSPLSPKDEIKMFFRTFKDWRMLSLIPVSFASNYFYTYQSAITAFLFDGRTRALVGILCGSGSMLSAIIFGMLVDKLPFSRRWRALTGCGIVFVVSSFVWSCGVVFQIQFQRGQHSVRGHPVPWDFQNGVAKGPILLMLAYHVSDSTVQGLANYVLSSLTNDPFTLARMAGFYQGVQALGTAVAYAMDAFNTPYWTEFIVSWMLLVVSIPLMTLISSTIQETNYCNEKTMSVDDINRPRNYLDEPKTDHGVNSETPEKARDLSEEKDAA